MPIEPISHFYEDWKFWSFFASMLAILLSQLPPFWHWWKSRRLNIELYSKMHITHKYGNPNAQLHLVVTNTGGRKVRVTGITLNVKSTSGQLFALPAATFLQDQSDKDTRLFTPFTLRPDEEWGHIVMFFPDLSRQDEKTVKDSVAPVRRDIVEKRKALNEPVQDVEADEHLIRPFHDLFRRQFKWHADEYEMTVSLTTDLPSEIENQRFHFTIFESDEADLKSVADRYIFGDGIFFEGAENPGVFVRFK